MISFTNRFGRRGVALFWLLIVSVVIGVLIYQEQIATLYVVATLSLVALLLVVGFADLENIGVESAENLSSDTE